MTSGNALAAAATLAALSVAVGACNRSGTSPGHNEKPSRTRAATPSPATAPEAVRLDPEAASRSFECLQSAPEGELALGFGVRGCFDGSEYQLTIRWSASGGEITAYTGWFGEYDYSGTVRVSTGEARWLVARLLEAARQPEVRSGCWSTTRTFAEMRWRCGALRTESVRYQSSDCSPHSALALNPGAYARAVGISEEARAIFRRYWAKKPRPGRPDQDPAPAVPDLPDLHGTDREVGQSK